MDFAVKFSQTWGSGRTRRSRRSQHQSIHFRGLRARSATDFIIYIWSTKFQSLSRLKVLLASLAMRWYTKTATTCVCASPSESTTSLAKGSLSTQIFPMLVDKAFRDEAALFFTYTIFRFKERYCWADFSYFPERLTRICRRQIWYLKIALPAIKLYQQAKCESMICFHALIERIQKQGLLANSARQLQVDWNVSGGWRTSKVPGSGSSGFYGLRPWAIGTESLRLSENIPHYTERPLGPSVLWALRVRQPHYRD